MTRRIVRGIILACLLGCGCARSGAPVAPARFPDPQEVRKGQGYMVLADRRAFVVMAFLNAVGYDQEIEGRAMHPVRAKVRERLSQNLAEHAVKVNRWRRYYESRKLGTFHYQDYALSLSVDYPFRQVHKDNELGYPMTATRLRDFPEILNDFWVTGELEAIWNEVRPDYVAELAKYDFARMDRQMRFLWEYLRMPRRDTLTLVNVPNLLDRHYHAIGARYDNYYYTVESPGSHSYGLNIHEYLHSVVNPIVRKNAELVQGRAMAYYEAGKDGPMSRSYREPITFTYECLVRALDHRLRALLSDGSEGEKRAEARMVQLSQEGLTLSLPFYRLLADYEQSDKPFDQFVPTMLTELPPYGQ